MGDATDYTLECVKDDKPSGCKFYYVDGPLAGQCKISDFRNEVVNGYIYKKTTYGCILTVGDYEYRLYVDVAYVSEPTSFPSGALEYIKVEYHHADPEPEVKQLGELPGIFKLIHDD